MLVKKSLLERFLFNNDSQTIFQMVTCLKKKSKASNIFERHINIYNSGMDDYQVLRMILVNMTVKLNTSNNFKVLKGPERLEQTLATYS